MKTMTTINIALGILFVVVAYRASALFSHPPVAVSTFKPLDEAKIDLTPLRLMPLRYLSTTSKSSKEPKVKTVKLDIKVSGLIIDTLFPNRSSAIVIANGGRSSLVSIGDPIGSIAWVSKITQDGLIVRTMSGNQSVPFVSGDAVSGVLALPPAFPQEQGRQFKTPAGAVIIHRNLN